MRVASRCVVPRSRAMAGRQEGICRQEINNFNTRGHHIDDRRSLETGGTETGRNFGQYSIGNEQVGLSLSLQLQGRGQGMAQTIRIRGIVLQAGKGCLHRYTANER